MEHGAFYMVGALQLERSPFDHGTFPRLFCNDYSMFVNSHISILANFIPLKLSYANKKLYINCAWDEDDFESLSQKLRTGSDSTLFA